MSNRKFSDATVAATIDEIAVDFCLNRKPITRDGLLDAMRARLGETGHDSVAAFIHAAHVADMVRPRPAFDRIRDRS